MEITKTIANCPVEEFLPQAYKIVAEFKRLSEDKKIKAIRAKAPKFSGTETLEEQEKIKQEQGAKNLEEILRVIMVEEPKKMARLLALICFVDEKAIQEYSGIDLMLPVFDVLANPQIINFFTRLMGLIN